MITDVELDAAQRAAASIPPEERQIVIAGPGAGKSEVVGALARNLVDEGVFPESILVISFSRAAVDVVRRRTADVTDEGEEVDIATIDSLAARIIRDNADEDIPFAGYDRNIEIVTRFLSESDEPLLDDVDHVIVDEMQDVVGVRARFVEALLTEGVRDDTGFTLLGDPLQSIYGFAEKDVDARSAEQLVTRLQTRFRPTVRELTGEYRSRTADARSMGAARSELLHLAGEHRLRRLRGLLADLAPLGDLDDDVIADIRDWRGTTALLCDTNARAALVAEHFTAAGVPVETAESSAHPALAPWLAEVLAGRRDAVVGREEFLDSAQEAGVADPAEAWRVLVTLSNSRKGLDVGRLLDRLAGRTVPLELARRVGSDIVASTVHRAKGLEFDNVVMIDPDRWTHKNTGPDDEARVLFVAASRAHSRLTTAQGPETKRWSKGRPPWSRWEIRPFPRAMPDGTLLTSADLWPSPDIVRALTVGTPVEWERREEGHLDAEENEVPAWNACVDGEVVAVTGADFGHYMKTQRQFDRLHLEGGRVFGSESRIVAGPGGNLDFRVMPRIAGPLTWERI